MDLRTFRILHSTVIEQYQFIEMQLEGMYAVLSGKGLCDGLKDVERDSLNKIISLIQKQEKDCGIRVISDTEYKDLKIICLRRNFWVHNCYVDMTFDRRTEGPKKEADVQQLYHDVQMAEQMRNLLFERKIELLHRIENKNNLNIITP